MSNGLPFDDLTIVHIGNKAVHVESEILSLWQKRSITNANIRIVEDYLKQRAEMIRQCELTYFPAEPNKIDYIIQLVEKIKEDNKDDNR
jgi:hypothetical protein